MNERKGTTLSAAPAHYQAGYVNPMVTYYRGLLGQVDPTVADLIGQANAERIVPFGVSRLIRGRSVNRR